MKKIVLALPVLFVALSAGRSGASVLGSPHDFSGVSAYHLCQTCHVPHNAAGGKRLWREASLGTGGSDWSGSSVGRLCGTCHDGGALAMLGNRFGQVPSQQTGYAYSVSAHGRNYGTLVGTNSTDLGDTPANAASRPYLKSGALMECSTCHDPHFHGTYSPTSPYRPFLRVDQSGAMNTISKFCADCHGNRYTVDRSTGPNHPVDIAYDIAEAANRHRKMRSSLPAALTNYVGDHNWRLGSKFEADGNGTPLLANYSGSVNGKFIGCTSCHAIHGPQTASTDQALWLLAIDNSVGTTSALCEGCHGQPTTPDPVKGIVTYYQTGFLEGDHPIDASTTAGPMILEKWLVDTPARVERHSSAGNSWPKNGGYLVCSSCHSMHKSSTVLNMLRRTDGGTAYALAGLFCNACHNPISPLGHHSFGDYFPGDHSGNYAYSKILCKDCHGFMGENIAHNGFLVTVVVPNINSALCMSCHENDASYSKRYDISDPQNVDPVEGLKNNTRFAGFQIPQPHLSQLGAGARTHFIGPISAGATAGTSFSLKTSAWNANPRSKSKFGDDGKQIICESCHSMLYNIGAGVAAGSSLSPSSGYVNNLLLQDYRDDSENTVVSRSVKSEFCLGCHNNGVSWGPGPVTLPAGNYVAIAPQGIHPMTGWSVTRAVDGGRPDHFLKTANDSPNQFYADAASAPPASGGVQRVANDTAGKVSYPGQDEMDCDSCHRPHEAAPGGVIGSTITGLSNVSVIAEDMATNETSILCQKCHSY